MDIQKKIDEKREADRRVRECLGRLLNASEQLAEKIPGDCRPLYGRVLQEVHHLTREINLSNQRMRSFILEIKDEIHQDLPK